MDKPRLPDVTSQDTLKLSKNVVDDIYAKIIKSSQGKDGSPCEWCGKANWCIEQNIYTETLFDIPGDSHVHNKVEPMVILHCINCGNNKKFSLSHFGYTTKGGVTDGGE